MGISRSGSNTVNMVIRQPFKNGILDYENPLELSSSVVDTMRRCAIDRFPNEMCGLIVNGEWVEAENIAEDKKVTWLIDQDFQSSFNPDDIQGVVHSHCKPHIINPTKTDMQFQMEDGNPWGIIYTDGTWGSKPLWWGDFRLDEPLVGRTFVHGVTDCYSAIRSWRWQKRGHYIPEFPRNTDWWKNAKDEGSMYAKGAVQLAYRIDRSDVEPGDAALFQFLEKIPHHAAIIADNGQMYHHIQDQLSGHSPLGNYQQFATSWWRFKSVGAE